MNPIDDQLNRLFRAARTTEAVDAAVPFGLETRALAAWRDSGKMGAGLWDMGLLSRGLIVAILIMGVSLGSALFKTTSDPLTDYVQASDTSLAADETP